MAGDNDQCKDEHGAPSGCPYQVVLEQSKVWDDVWTGDDTSQAEHGEALDILRKMLALDPDVLEPITGSDLAEAARRFKTRTATPDGWHPRSYGYLGEESRECLARLLNLCENMGVWPQQQSSVHMSIHEKPSGGKRLIGWYRAFSDSGQTTVVMSGGNGKTSTPVPVSSQLRVATQWWTLGGGRQCVLKSASAVVTTWWWWHKTC